MRVLLTGGEGTIGRVLRDRLPFELTPFDLPACDARDYGQLLAAVQGHDAIVHLAWDVTENHLHNAVEPDNVVMTDNVYRAAREAGVPRVVMASSVHADAYHDADPARPLDPFALPIPDGPYGASKVFLEALGRHYAVHQGLRVFCVRFGGVLEVPHRNHPASEQSVWLGFDDCAALVQACLEADVPKGHYEIITGVSRNVEMRHSTRNTIGWTPRQKPPTIVRRAVRSARRRLARD
jgi:nucleoside-diphosphate-sugar epimerase